MGANGSKPLLGRAGAVDNGGGPSAARAASKPPTFRVPGASVAARVAADNATRANVAAQGGVAGASPAAAAANARTADAGGGTRASAAGSITGAANGQLGGMHSGFGDCDEEGFQPVRARGWRKARGGQGTGVQGAADKADEEARAAQGDEVEQSHPAPSDLRRAWQDEISIARQLKHQGLATDHPAMRAACEARDAAESAWRSAKDPAPAAVRLARAQARLDRAIELQTETRNALADYEREHAAKLAVLHSRMDEDRTRVRLRRQ